MKPIHHTHHTERKRRTAARLLTAGMISLLMLVSGIPNGAATQDRGLTVVWPDEEDRFELSQFYENSWLFVIGIDEYPYSENFPDLQNAVNDAKGVRDVMQQYFGFDTEYTIELYNEDATKNNILRAFDRLANETGRDDRVLVFYAGHGTQHELGDGRMRGHIIPHDGTEGQLFATTISTDDLVNYGEAVPAKHMYYIMDACYGGMIHTTRATSISPDTRNYMDIINQRRTRQAITAGGANEVVTDHGPSGHSLFTYNLITGLRDGLADLHGNGIITASELRQFMVPRIQTESRGRQTPQAGILPGDDMGDFIFVRVDAVHETEEIFEIVEITSDPVDAVVLLDGQPVGITPYEMELIPGLHLVTVHKDGYGEEQRTVNVTRFGENRFNFDLEAEFQPVTFASNVPEVDLFINNVHFATIDGMDVEWDLRPGTYRIRAERDRYSTEVREIRVEPGAENRFDFELESLYARLSIDADPPDARIFLDDEFYDEGSLDREVQRGSYRLRIAKEGYIDLERRIEVIEDDHNYEFELSRAYVPLAIRSNVDEAEVYINGEHQGMLSDRFFETKVPLGSYEIELNRSRYRRLTETVDISQTDPLELDLEMISLYADLTIDVYQDDARIRVNNEYLGRGQTQTNIRKGTAAIDIRMDGYDPIEENVEIEDDEMVLNYELEPILATYTIHSDPSGAHLYVNGNRMRTTPEEVALGYGSHEVRVERVNYEPESRHIYVETSIEDGYEIFELTKTVSYATRLRFEDRRSKYRSRFWFNTVMAAGAAGAVYYFEQEAQNAYDSYSQEELTARLYSDYWDRYEENIQYRNIAVGTAAFFTTLATYRLLRRIIQSESKSRRRVEQERFSLDLDRRYDRPVVQLRVNF